MGCVPPLEASRGLQRRSRVLIRRRRTVTRLRALVQTIPAQTGPTHRQFVDSSGQLQAVGRRLHLQLGAEAYRHVLRIGPDRVHPARTLSGRRLGHNHPIAEIWPRVHVCQHLRAPSDTRGTSRQVAGRPSSKGASSTPAARPVSPRPRGRRPRAVNGDQERRRTASQEHRSGRRTVAGSRDRITARGDGLHSALPKGDRAPHQEPIRAAGSRGSPDRRSATTLRSPSGTGCPPVRIPAVPPPPG